MFMYSSFELPRIGVNYNPYKSSDISYFSNSDHFGFYRDKRNDHVSKVIQEMLGLNITSNSSKNKKWEKRINPTGTANWGNKRNKITKK